MQDLAGRLDPALALLSFSDFVARVGDGECNNRRHQWSYKVVSEGQRLEGSQMNALSIVES